MTVYQNINTNYIFLVFKVKVTMKQPNATEEKFIRQLRKGDFFGEKALQGYVHLNFTLNFIKYVIFIMSKWLIIFNN